MNNRYDEAVQCHHNAAELLLDAMKSTTSSIALESITLQHSYHLKQKDIIKGKKEQYARVKKAVDNFKLLGKDAGITLKGNDYGKLQVAIYRAIHETDSLLHTLLDKPENLDEGLQTGLAKDAVDGIKAEKSKEIVVEELQILSQSLHSLVEQLVVQVEVLKDENATLREKVSYLEKERVKFLNLGTPYNDLQRNFDLESVQKQEPRDSQSRPTNVNVERPPQQPHFDLSALK